jgi:hypothetical protein
VAPIDDGHALHYSAVERGTPVYGSDEQLVGKVVDAPEVARTAERGVTLTIPAAEAAQLGPPPSGPKLGRGGLKRLFGGLRR